jgi:hypothetical protein
MSIQNSKNWSELTQEDKKKIAFKNPFYKQKKEQEKNVEKQNINVDNYIKEEDKKKEPSWKHVLSNVNKGTMKPTYKIKKKKLNFNLNTDIQPVKTNKIAQTEANIGIKQLEGKKNETKHEDKKDEAAKSKNTQLNNIHKNYAKPIPVSNSDSENDQKSAHSEFDGYDISEG